MNREYLEDYKQKEDEELDRFLLQKIRNGTFSFREDRYPPTDRFFKLNEPVAVSSLLLAKRNSIWGQVPFSGSMVLRIPPLSQSDFESMCFEVSKIPEIINFIKETGRLQVGLNFPATAYQGLDYLDPFFTELRPPYLCQAPLSILWSKEEIDKAANRFGTLAAIKFINYLRNLQSDRTRFREVLNRALYTYVGLKLGNYTLVEDIENLLVDCPTLAHWTLMICKHFITDPPRDVFSRLINYSKEAINLSRFLPQDDQPGEIRFPIEIGKFLMKDKLTYAPEGLEACKDIIYHYQAYDLQKVQRAMNDGIVLNHPDILAKSAEDLSEILDNLWNDETIPNRIKNIKIGVPVSIAAIGGIVAGLPGFFAGGFLSELGFKVVEKTTQKYAEKLFSEKGEGLTEKLAILRTKSYQVNIYDFRKKYYK